MKNMLWQPSDETKKKTNLWAFKQQIEDATGASFPDFDAIWNWSITEPEKFWAEVANFCQLQRVDQSGPILETPDDLLQARFFPNNTLNYAQNLLAHDGTGEAIVAYNESKSSGGNEAIGRRALSWQEVRAKVSQLQQALTASGVQQGDRVAGFIPNIPEAIIAMLAATSLGAIWSSCSPNFGTAGVVDRFGQIEPKILFATNGYTYNGKPFSTLPTVTQLSNDLPSLEKTIIVPFLDDAASHQSEQDLLTLDEFITPYQPKDLTFTPLSFDAPLFIMYSSGTTGLPKCIVHSVGGTLLQHLKEHQLQTDIHPKDRVFYYTTCGWMMWNWLVSALASKATIVLYDGNPFYPDGNRLSQLCEQEKLTHFGVSAKYFDSCYKAGIAPAKTCDLTPLRVILSTGSPLSADRFDYIYSEWKQDMCLSSIAGGTDILGAFFGGNPIGPVFRGQCQKRGLGMNVQIFNDQGQSVENTPGELVCIAPHPSQPVGFWNDPDQTRYKKAYYDKWPNVWCHGDLVELKSEGGAIFHGRSDTTLNPGGVRIGTAEIYRQIESLPEILEPLVVGQNHQDDVRVVLFVTLREGVGLDDALVDKIKQTIRSNATARHVPALIFSCPDLPRTRSGKISEIAVRDVIHGRRVKNKEALLNPESLGFFEALPGL